MPFQGKNSPLNLSQLPSKGPEQAKNISYSTSDGFGEFFSSDIMWWLGDWDTTDPAPAPVASKEPEKGKRYFGLYLLVGGRKP